MHFPAAGSGLERYAARFGAVEINSTFYRSHRPDTWARWGASVPSSFRFAVKLPKAISHERRLVGCKDLVQRLLDETAVLGDKLAVLLLQLPPTLKYDASLIEDFLTSLTASTAAKVVCEPRHPSWFETAPERALDRLGVARVAADPARVPLAAQPGGWRGLSYWRLHGSPQMYRSPYGADRLADYAVALDEDGAATRPSWWIFDNTASGAAAEDALTLQRIEQARRGSFRGID